MESWEKIKAVQNMQDYINLHINEPISLYSLSQAAGYSPWHCAKIFKELIGKAPFEYIRSLRLSQAALQLRDEKVKVIDVAFDFVFDSHEGFTRAFAKEFGITPHKYSKAPPPINLFKAYPIKDYYQYLLSGGKTNETENKHTPSTVFVQLVERPKRKLILKRGRNADDYFEYCIDIGYDVWGLLCSIKEALYEPVGMWLPRKLRPEGSSLYVQGVEVPVDYAGIIPEGFEIIELPPCKMMVFQGPPFEDEKYLEAIKEVTEAFKSYNPRLYGFDWADEASPRFQLEPQGYRGYIEARPVRQIQYTAFV
ncbi:MAG: transcriptional regulator [Clostridia bacterium BRH_c25]|nr:MAG: transcriptional regulator [Clostridia bacterium BRH_c25]